MINTKKKRKSRKFAESSKVKKQNTESMLQLRSKLNVAERRILNLNNHRVQLQNKINVLTDDNTRMRLQIQQLQFELMQPK